MAAEKKTATPTEYLVFKHVGDTTAGSAPGAVRAVVSELAPGEQAGTFVAIPARSFKPVTVNPQTTIRLELTEAKA